MSRGGGVASWLTTAEALRRGGLGQESVAVLALAGQGYKQVTLRHAPTVEGDPGDAHRGIPEQGRRRNSLQQLAQLLNLSRRSLPGSLLGTP